MRRRVGRTEPCGIPEPYWNSITDNPHITTHIEQSLWKHEMNREKSSMKRQARSSALEISRAITLLSPHLWVRQIQLSESSAASRTCSGKTIHSITNKWVNLQIVNSSQVLNKIVVPTLLLTTTYWNPHFFNRNNLNKFSDLGPKNMCSLTFRLHTGV